MSFLKPWQTSIFSQQKCCQLLGGGFVSNPHQALSLDPSGCTAPNPHSLRILPSHFEWPSAAYAYIHPFQTWRGPNFKNMGDLGWLRSPKVVDSVTVRRRAYDVLFTFHRDCMCPSCTVFEIQRVTYNFHIPWVNHNCRFEHVIFIQGPRYTSGGPRYTPRGHGTSKSPIPRYA